VQLGPQVGNNWLVESGVSAGNKVIVDNLQKLKDGAPVNPHEAPAPTTTAQTTTASAGR
jgi:membrane fusion protein, multidrug efflux system